MENKTFIHLRNHSYYSVAEGALKMKDFVDLCHKHNMPAVAITDTNAAFGLAEFSDKLLSAKDGNIQPILGAQVNLPLSLKDNEKNFGQLVLLVQNEEGYVNLCKILSLLYLQPFSDQIPALNWENLQKHNKGLICLTGGINGVIGKNILLNQSDTVKEITKLLKEIFGNRLYIELQRHNLATEKRCEPEFLKLSNEFNIEIVATNENYFKDKDMYQAHCAFLCISEVKTIYDEDVRKETEEHYFKSSEQMWELFKDLPSACENTVIIAKRCAYKVPKRDPLLPHAYDITKHSEKEILRYESEQGLKERLSILKLTPEEEKKYWERLEFEINVINNMGFPGYFLIVSDFIKWGKNENIPIGPGRGSGAGSIVAWSLKITDLNPLDYGLLFERFLNPDRISMPDFDIDFCQDRRDEVIRYVQEKYGKDKVAQIITFGTLKAKGLIRDVGRVMAFPYGMVDRIAKLIPNPVQQGEEITIEKALNAVPELDQMRKEDEQVQQLLSYAQQLEGLIRHTSIHAAGIVIGDRPLDELCPLYLDDKAIMPVVQFNMKYIEDTGLIKYDFLGLKTLSVIQNAVKMIKKTKDISIDIDHLDLTDPEVYKLYANGDTIGLFQFESGGMQKHLIELQPTKIDELIAMNALYRPGPMENIPTFTERRHGRLDIIYPHPLSEEILKPTYGIIVYQEQVMQMSQAIAGFTKGQADTLRKAMGKKIVKMMEELKVLFMEGSANNGIGQEKADEIWKLMEKFAHYGFNKSHAACYAYISYQTAYLKAYHRPEFMACTMNYDMNDSDKLESYFKDCKKAGVEVLPPCINKSESLFATENGAIRYALAGIKGVGVEAMNKIIAEREKNGPFLHMTDFISRIPYQSLNKGAFEKLIKAGAFDCLDPDRGRLLFNMDMILNQLKILEDERTSGQQNFFADLTTDTSDYLSKNYKKTTKLNLNEQIKQEFEAIGFYITNHPLFSYKEILEKKKILNSSFFKTMKDNTPITCAGIINAVFHSTTKEKNRPMIKIRLSDMESEFESLYLYAQKPVLDMTENDSPWICNINKDILKKDTPIVITGSLKRNNDSSYVIWTNTVETLDSYLLKTTFHFTLNLTNNKQLETIKEILATAKEGNALITIQIPTGSSITTLSLPKKFLITDNIYDKLKKAKIPLIFN